MVQCPELSSPNSASGPITGRSIKTLSAPQLRRKGRKKERKKVIKRKKIIKKRRGQPNQYTNPPMIRSAKN